MLTIYEDAQYQADASMAGASAYVIKRKMHTELIPVLINLLALTDRSDGIQESIQDLEAKMERR